MNEIYNFEEKEEEDEYYYARILTNQEIVYKNYLFIVEILIMVIYLKKNILVHY